MKKARISFFLCILVVYIITGCNLGGTGTGVKYPDGPYGVNQDDIIANISLPEADGGNVALSDAYNSYLSTPHPKAVVVDFSKVSSASSQEAASGLQTIYTDYISSGDNIEIITILLDGTSPLAQQWKTNYSLTFKVTYDSSGELTNHYNITTFPTFYIVDPSTMKIVQRIEGWVDTDTLENAIDPVVAGN